MASAASHMNKRPDVGDHIMVAGLSFQVATLFVFQLLCLDFGVKTLKRMRVMGEEAFDERHKALRGSAKFRLFLVALGLATLCIFIRSVYRVAELSEGWQGALIKNQHLFIGFEGAMVIVAVLVLNIFHPGYCFREGYTQRKYRNLFKRNWKKGAVEEVDEKGTPLRDSGVSSKEEQEEPDFPDFVQRGRMDNQAFVRKPKKGTQRPVINSRGTEDDLFVTPRTSIGDGEKGKAAV